jgi:hypothetical protein
VVTKTGLLLKKLDRDAFWENVSVGSIDIQVSDFHIKFKLVTEQ